MEILFTRVERVYIQEEEGVVKICAVNHSQEILEVDLFLEQGKSPTVEYLADGVRPSAWGRAVDFLLDRAERERRAKALDPLIDPPPTGG